MLLIDAGDVRWELPPRARRIHVDADVGVVITGTTSACAENTFIFSAIVPKAEELPPRARRIPQHPSPASWQCGTTSACAENTTRPPHAYMGPGNYLRVRGEYYSPREICGPALELPPRARRIPPPGSHAPIYMGTTSACAENTPPPTAKAGVPWNYLRVRGEYLGSRRSTTHQQELPPRARRIPGFHGCRAAFPGTTSACAENTSCCSRSKLHTGNYLRVRGEYAESIRPAKVN